MKNKCKKYGGYTLVEMIISIAILGMIMTPIYTMLIVTQKSNKDGSIKQTAALHGQEIFEEIKNEDLVQNKDADGKVIETKIGDIKILNNIGSKGFGDDYSATVELVEDTTTSDEFNQETTTNQNTKQETTTNQNNTVETIDFNGLVVSDNNSIMFNLNGNEGSIESSTIQNGTLKFSINTKTDVGKKIVEIRDNFNESISTTFKEIDKSEKNTQMNVALNFEKYNTQISNKVVPVEIIVYNQDDIPLNISLQKASNLDVKTNTKLGNVRVFDNRSSTSSESSKWYIIKVKVTQRINDVDQLVFTEETRQKIKVNSEVS